MPSLRQQNPCWRAFTANRRLLKMAGFQAPPSGCIWAPPDNRLDRLARSIRDGINLLTDWINAGVRIVIVTMQIDLSGALGQTVAALLLGLAQMERETIRERQAAGIAAARARGQQWGGRKPGTATIDYDRAEELRRKGLSVAEIASALGCSKASLYPFLRAKGLTRNWKPTTLSSAADLSSDTE